MKTNHLMRPDRLVLGGVKTMSNIISDLYSTKKSEAKGKAELTFIGDQKSFATEVQLYIFNEKEWSKKSGMQILPELELPSADQNYWVNFHGIHEVDSIKRFCERFDVDRLVQRNILDTTLRPKVDEFDRYIFFSLKSTLAGEHIQLKTEQLSFILGTNYVFSFQEELGDHFDDIRKKIEEKVGFIRVRSIDYLLIQLIDAILDNYFETIETLNSKLPAIEAQIYDNPDRSQLIEIEKLKQTAHLIKKALKPFKESLQILANSQSKFFRKSNRKFLVDLLNSASSALEEVESTQNALEGLTNIYFATDSQRMNETMKFLTLVATIFIPLTFLAGIYGMNFEYMPELGYKYGYFMTLGVMLVLAIIMLVYFRRKKWL